MESIVYYGLVYTWMTSQISNFQDNLMGRATTLVVAVAYVMLTIWVMIIGYRIVTGQTRQPLMGVVADMAKIVLIVSIAAGWSSGASYIENLLSTDLPNEIMSLLSGSDDTVSQKIDQNLTYTQLAMTAVDAVQVAPGDVEGADAKARASQLATFGTASPPMVAGAMYLMYKWFMAFFIGLGPIFVMCLIFERTKHLFDKWLYFGISTMFSMAALAVMTTVALKLTMLSAGVFFAGDVLSKIFPINTEGLTSQAMEQGGVGLLMTLMLVTVPRAVGNYFGGALGEFMHASAFAGSGGQTGAQNQLGGSYKPPLSQSPNTNAGQHGAGGDAYGAPNPGSDPRLTGARNFQPSNQDGNSVRTPSPVGDPMLDPRVLGKPPTDSNG